MIILTHMRTYNIYVCISRNITYNLGNILYKYIKYVIYYYKNKIKIKIKFDNHLDLYKYSI